MSKKYSTCGEPKLITVTANKLPKIVKCDQARRHEGDHYHEETKTTWPQK